MLSLVWKRVLPPHSLSLLGKYVERRYVLNTLTHRFVHSATQIKRLFKNHPATVRVKNRLKAEKPEPVISPYQRLYEPVHTNFTMLPNGWSSPPDSSFTLPNYPFFVQRTKNKPNDTIGFLPVYSKRWKDGTKITTRIRKVSGDYGVFLQEMRSVLGLPQEVPGKKVDEYIRIRTGGTIEIKGNRVQEIRLWLAGLGF